MNEIELEMRKYLERMSADMNKIISIITNSSTRTNFLTLKVLTVSHKIGYSEFKGILSRQSSKLKYFNELYVSLCASKQINEVSLVY